MAKHLWTPKHHTHKQAFHNLITIVWMSLYGVALPFPFTKTKGPSTNLLQYDNFSVYKAISLTTWYAKVGVEELEWVLPKPS